MFRSSSYRTFWLLAVCLCSLLFLVPLAQAAGKAEVRVGKNGENTRLVFEFTRLTAYNVEQNGDRVKISFDTPFDMSAPGATPAPLKSMDISRQDKFVVNVALGLESGATIKHYRLQRKIIVDIYPAHAPPEPTPNPKVAQEPKEKPAEPKMPAAPVAPVETATETPPPLPANDPSEKELSQALGMMPPAEDNKPDEDSALVVDSAPAAEPAAEPEPPAAPETVISISTVAPAKAAVFTRFDTLWIVLDSASAAAPTVTGPDEGFLGRPKTLKFAGGTAYRYAMPKQRHISVERRNLAWRVTLGTEVRLPPSAADISIAYDAQSRKARLLAAMRDAGNVLEIEDPSVGDRLLIVPVSAPTQRIDNTRRYADVSILRSFTGLVVRPISDGVRATRLNDYIVITAPNGIQATPGAASAPSIVNVDRTSDAQESRLFDFPNWRQGGIDRLTYNKQLLQNKIATAQSDDERAEYVLKLALLYFANNFGHETLSLLRILTDENGEFAKNPNIIALRGAAAAMAGHYDDAIRDLSHPAIQQHPEVALWTGYAAAATEQWTKAERSFPKDNRLLVEYPPNIAVPLTIYMAEAALRLGNVDTANGLLETLATYHNGEQAQFEAAAKYLRGEAARQAGRFDEALMLWQEVEGGLDQLYHTKAGLSLANLQLQEKKISIAQAIDRVDGLRFAWRGDGLEIQTLFTLGRMKLQNQNYLSGLQDFKTAIGIAKETNDDPAPLQAEIARTVYGLFIGNEAEKISPLEAVSVYSEFSDYLPPGEEGMRGALNFADYLVSMDLLGKAADLIKAQMDSGAPGIDRAQTGAKLATVYLLDSRPLDALSALSASEGTTDTKLIEKRTLLKARAHAQLKRTDDAIALLNNLNSRDAIKLKADVLWRARKWGQAAQAINSLLPASANEKLDDETARLVVNAAVAYKLAGDGQNLAALRDKYETRMTETTLGPSFRVVTREGGSAALADRDTILKIAGEVDMFKGFLDSYKTVAGGG